MEKPKTIGRYEIVEELGRGAMGTVYRAKDPAMDRTVALKTIISVALASEQGSEFRERFYREARAAGRLAHPGIVAMFDVGEHEDLPFMVMEFVEGQTLADAVRKGERQTLERVCEIGQQIAEALGYAHQHGVVHRDIKPANILLTSRETYGIERPKITDFGVAKLAAGQITTSGQMLGTPAFMPPEQFTGAPIDGRADLFSLGVILYWMATGEQPFPGETMTAVSYKVVHTEPVRPQKLNPSIPDDLDRAILKCLAKSPANRYQTGEELAQELAALRTGGRPSMRVPTPQASPTESFGATLDSRPGTAPPNAISPVPEKMTPSTPAKKLGGRYILAVVVAVVVVTSGWYAMRNKNGTKETASPTPVVSATPPPELPAPVPVPQEPVPAPAAEAPLVKATPIETKPAVKSVKKDEKKPEAKTEALEPPKSAPAVSIAAPPPVAAPAAKETAAVDFDPKALNPRENTRLKIDANQMPANLDFTIEMNGKAYFRRNIAGNKAEYEDLFVPPGVQEFRVTAHSNGVEKASNTVSTEFNAKKKKTLRIELRTQGLPASSGMPKDLYSDSQLVLTLK